MPMDIPHDRHERATNPPEARAPVQTEAREQAHAPTNHVAAVFAGHDGDIDDVQWNREEMS